MIEFFASLGWFGWGLIVLVGVLLWNARRLIFLRAKMDDLDNCPPLDTGGRPEVPPTGWTSSGGDGQ